MTSKFILVHSKEGVEDAKARTAADKQPSTLDSVKHIASHLGGALGGALLDGIGAGGGLFSNVLGHTAAAGGGGLPEIGTLRKLGRRFKFPPQEQLRFTVGLWSLNAWLGSMTRLIEGLNGAQQTFIFYEVAASVPAGLISRTERTIPWLEEALTKSPNPKTRANLEEARQTIADSLIANDFYGLADSVRTDLGLDYVIGITPSMVAGEDTDGSYYTDHFSTYDNNTILASSYELHEFVEKSGFSFESFLATILISELLVAVCANLDYHDDRGCFFDNNDIREGLIADLKDLEIEPGCMELIDLKYREAAQSFVKYIQSIRGGMS